MGRENGMSKNYEVTVAGTFVGSGALEINAAENVTVTETVISSVVQRPGVEPEALIYLQGTPIAEVLRDSSRIAGFQITELQIEDYTKEIKEKGWIRPIEIGGSISEQGASVKVELKSKGQTITERKITIKWTRDKV